MVIIAVLGFPKSGKSTWLSQQYNVLRSQGKSFFIQRACPDGEGQWTFESPNGKALRVKGKFNPQFVKWVKDSALNLAKTFETVYLDCGGRQSQENAEILQICEGAIIIGRTLEDIESWVNFVKNANSKVSIIACYLSSWDGEKVVYKQIQLT
ncbi:MAG: hypothetical protein ACTSV7_00140 [Candidatus Baldrarchaeia archaeon]